MIVGAVQMDVVLKDKERNLRKVSDLIGDRKLDLAVLPELFSTGYYHETREALFEIAEPVPDGPTTRRLHEIAREKRCHLVGALVEHERDRLFITAVMVGPQGFVGKQRKRHLTQEEKAHFAPGEESFVFDVGGCKVGVVICFDGWFPETVRELTLKGAQVVCHSALICSTTSLDIMRVRALENNAFVVVANGIQTETHLGQSVRFRGESRVIDPAGDILVDAGQGEKLISTLIDERQTARKCLEDCDDLVAEIRSHAGTMFAGAPNPSVAG
jgi:predicted amidohydrolase